MEMAQSTLAAIFGVSVQTLALWEKSKSKITAPAEKLLRLVVKGHFNGNATIRRAIEVLNHLDIEEYESKLVFQENGKKWSATAA